MFSIMIKRKYNISKRKHDGLFAVHQWMLDPTANELREQLRRDSRPIKDWLKYYRWVCIEVFKSRFKAVKFVEDKNG